MKRALLVIDVQNEYLDGNLPIVHPDPAVSLSAIGSAMDAATKTGVPVVVVQTILAEASPIFAKGTYGARLHPSVADRPWALLVTKPLPSCLAGTDLIAWLASGNIDTLTLTGYMTHNCVDATARHASHLGFNVEVLADATGSLPYCNSAGTATAEELHRVFLTALHARFAAVMLAADWCALLPSSPSLGPAGIWSSSHHATIS
jgi:nicotinamidase-related amidase